MADLRGEPRGAAVDDGRQDRMVVVEAVDEGRVPFVVVKGRRAVEEVLDLVLSVEPAFNAGVHEQQQDGVHDGDVQKHPLTVKQFPVRDQGVQFLIGDFRKEIEHDGKQREHSENLCHGHEPGVFPLEREAVVEFDVLAQHRQRGGEEHQNVFQSRVSPCLIHSFLRVFVFCDQ